MSATLSRLPRAPTPSAPIDLRRKVCLVGAPGVGKTSLVRRRVDSVFSHFTHVTVGVRVDKTVVDIDAGRVTCLLWDLRGDEIDRPVDFQHLDGMAGYLLVVDGCRRETLDSARVSVDRIETGFGPVPFVVLVNKADRADDWQVPRPVDAALETRALAVVESSAKTGRGVDEAFRRLAERLAADAAATEAAHAVGGTAFGRWA